MLEDETGRIEPADTVNEKKKVFCYVWHMASGR